MDAFSRRLSLDDLRTMFKDALVASARAERSEHEAHYYTEREPPNRPEPDINFVSCWPNVVSQEERDAFVAHLAGCQWCLFLFFQEMEDDLWDIPSDDPFWPALRKALKLDEEAE